MASAPELQKNARSANVASVSRFASRSAGSLVNQLDTCQILPACSVSALTIAGWQWPSAVTATPLAKSMYIRPAWSQTREPSPRTGRNGAGAKHGTITSSNVARVTGRDAALVAVAATSRGDEVATVAAADVLSAEVVSGEALAGEVIGRVERGGRQAGIGTAATTWISILYSGAASFASIVARAGVSPATTHFSHTAFIAAKSPMSGR